MKKIIIGMLVVLMSHSAFAALNRESREQVKQSVRTTVENNKTMKEILKEQQAGRDFTKNPELMAKIGRMLDFALKDVASYDKVKILSLLAIDPVTVMAEVGTISKLLKDPATTPAEKAQLTKQLELIVEASAHVNATARTEKEAQTNKANFQKVLELAENLSHLDFPASKKMVDKVEANLKSMDLESAINAAGKGAGKDGKDVTAKDIKEKC